MAAFTAETVRFPEDIQEVEPVSETDYLETLPQGTELTVTITAVATRKPSPESTSTSIRAAARPNTMA